jgi:hypothetical protein
MSTEKRIEKYLTQVVGHENRWNKSHPFLQWDINWRSCKTKQLYIGMEIGSDLETWITK